MTLCVCFNTLRPRQNGRHIPDDIFKCIFLNETMWITIKFSLKFVRKGPINNIPALVQIMAWRRPGDKPLSEPTLVSLLMYICVTRPQWVKQHFDTRYLVFYNPSPPRMFLSFFFWTFFQNVGFNTVLTDPFMSYLAALLGYSAGEFQALQLILLAAFGVVD